MFVSLSRIEHHTKGVCLLAEFHYRTTPVSASACHIQHNTRRLCWPLLFSVSIIPPSDVIKPRRVGRPHGLTITCWGCCGQCLDINQPSSIPIYSVLVSVSVFMALSTVFHSIHPPDNSPLSHSVLPVLFLPYWSFQRWSPRAHLHVVKMLRFMSDINQPSLPLFCSCVYFCLYGPFNRISFHKFSRQLSVFLLCSCSVISALLVLSTISL